MAAFPSSKPPSRLLTAEEFMRLPDSESGGKELIDGVVRVSSPVGLEHGEVADVIHDAVRRFLRQHKLGRAVQETGYRLRRMPDRVLAPDVSWLSGSRRPTTRAQRESFVEGAPDLAVEVVSPTDKQREVLEKVGQYLDAACPRVWVVRPRNQTVTVYRPDGTVTTLRAGEALTSDKAGFPVPGFSLPVAEIFEE